MRFVDRHELHVDAPAERTWAALAATLANADGPVARAGADLLRCVPRRTSGPPVPAVGAQTPGFRVTAAEAPRLLRIEGGDALARYACQFELEGQTLSVTTWARFDRGPLGALYRLAVIGTRGHAVTMRWLLRLVRRRARALGEAHR